MNDKMSKWSLYLLILSFSHLLILIKKMNKERLPGINLFNLTGKTAIITGGSQGLGLAMAEGLASAGANIVVVNRNAQKGVAAVAKIKQLYGVAAMSIVADVTSEEQTINMAKQAIDRFGKIDILINNAGISVRGGIDDLTAEEFKNVMDVNVTGVWLCTKALTPHMKANKNGRIINTGSTLGLVGYADRSTYVASKGAVVQMTKGLALELAPWNINVNVICPGPFLTEMSQGTANSPEANKMIIESTAVERWGDLKEIQGIAIYLASDAATYTVGAAISVDGGWVAK